MPSGKTDYAENRILDYLFGGQVATMARPTDWYIALYTVAPSDTGGGTEATGGGYARLQVANNTTNFAASSGGLKTNNLDIVWPTSSGAWSTGSPIVAAALFDALAGNMWYWGTIDTGQQSITAAGQQFVLPAGALDITED